RAVDGGDVARHRLKGDLGLHVSLLVRQLVAALGGGLASRGVLRHGAAEHPAPRQRRTTRISSPTTSSASSDHSFRAAPSTASRSSAPGGRSPYSASTSASALRVGVRALSAALARASISAAVSASANRAAIVPDGSAAPPITAHPRQPDGRTSRSPPPPAPAHPPRPRPPR